MLFSFVCRLCANSCYILSNPAPPHQIDQYVPTYGSSHPTEAANNSQTITQRAQCQFPSTPYWACSLLLATLRTYLYVIMATKHHPSYLSQHYVRLACQEGLSETFDGLAIILTEVKWKESKRGSLVILRLYFWYIGKYNGLVWEIFLPELARRTFEDANFACPGIGTSSNPDTFTTESPCNSVRSRLFVYIFGSKYVGRGYPFRSFWFGPFLTTGSIRQWSKSVWTRYLTLGIRHDVLRKTRF